MELAVQMGTPRAIAAFQSFDGLLKFHTGQWGEAERLLRESLQLSRTLGVAFGVSSGLRRLGRLLAARGEFEEAVQALEESVAVGEQAVLRAHSLARSYAALAGVRLDAGDVDEARRCLELGQEVATDHRNCTSCNALLLPAAVRVHLELGDLPGASEAVDSLERIAESYGGRAWTSMVRQARGRYLLAAGDLGQAQRAWDDAYRGFSKVGNVREAALSLQGLAQSLAHTEPQRSEQLHAQAEATLRSLRDDAGGDRTAPAK